MCVLTDDVGEVDEFDTIDVWIHEIERSAPAYNGLNFIMSKHLRHMASDMLKPIFLKTQKKFLTIPDSQSFTEFILHLLYYVLQKGNFQMSLYMRDFSKRKDKQKNQRVQVII